MFVISQLHKNDSPKALSSLWLHLSLSGRKTKWAFRELPVISFTFPDFDLQTRSFNSRPSSSTARTRAYSSTWESFPFCLAIRQMSPTFGILSSWLHFFGEKSQLTIISRRRSYILARYSCNSRYFVGSSPSVPQILSLIPARRKELGVSTRSWSPR